MKSTGAKHDAIADRHREAFGVLPIGSGSSLGREGPTVQICAGVASTLGRAAALSRESLRRVLPVGAAAGIAPSMLQLQPSHLQSKKLSEIWTGMDATGSWRINHWHSRCRRIGLA